MGYDQSDLVQAVKRAIISLPIQADRLFGIHLDEALQEGLVRFSMELLKWNRSFNLTSITEPAAIAELHLLDSLAIVPQLPAGSSVLDVGTGGGFPGIPVALARPDLRLTLVDRTEKKVIFLKSVVAKLGIKNVRPVHKRLEGAPLKEALLDDFFPNTGPGGAASQLAEPGPGFDVVVSRAFTAPKAWFELARSYVKGGGRVIAMLGADLPKREDLEADLRQGERIEVESYSLPGGAKRALAILHTP